MTGYSKDVFNSRKKKWTDIVFKEDMASMREAFRKKKQPDPNTS
ncbi:MAG: hypothetical protein ISS65_10000 [Desulfobacterales bacterium]|uniref:Uncharacterized protein n=1 Tax=Candidatus Desulfatibia profunda TaxID=2841695 RepID=A0A8J6NUR2_9BACT|nr:hypothetical protein [Candidatus Desulfatibia profunda]MBL7180522.1 hypothetical protein [Desulfobacterales bacterium]MBU0698526.1 PAS domain-containing protein [Pseudomonadota bacterium]